MCIHATYQYNTQHAGCEALSAVGLCTDAFVSGLDLDPKQHTSYVLIIYLWGIFTYCIVSISCDISHDTSIQICRACDRYSHRYMPNISHDISIILDTIPNTTSTEIRTHIWGYASLPLYTAYTVVPIVVLGFPTHSIPSRPNELRVFPSRATILWAEST